MSKSKKYANRSGARVNTAGMKPTQPAPPKPVESDLHSKIEKLYSQAPVDVQGAETLALAHVPPPPIDLAEIWKRGEDARLRFDAQTKRTQKAEEAAETKRQEYEHRQEEIAHGHQRIETERTRLAQFDTELSQRKSLLDERERALNERNEHVLKKEIDAEAGFLVRHRELLASIEAEIKYQRESITQERTHASAKLQSELQTLREQEMARLQAERAEFEAERSAFSEERSVLKHAQMRLRIDEELFQEDKKLLDAKVERLATARNDKLASDLKFAEESLQRVRADRVRLENILKEREHADQQFRGRTPEEILRELDNQKRDNQELRQQLAARPSEDDATRLQVLEQEKHEWQSELGLLRRQIAEYEVRIVRGQLPVIELETLRDQKAAYAASNSKLKADLAELRSDLERPANQGRQRLAFSACKAFDEDKNLQESPETQRIPDLKKLAENIQRRMVTYPADGTNLFYSISDVRSFLAGLAMGRLVILQGVSGTGKTSLPLAFAHAIGGGSELLEVQAGWRDRHDLIGHFNAFEGVFYESKFLRTLYTAQCPHFEDRPYFIILDEMNLSHVEQYFADFISVLEKPNEDDRCVDLMGGTLPEAQFPRLLLRNNRQGVAIKIPPNVWFVGTANHDETTKDFADKTYDRAHVMELPIKHKPFDAPRSGSPPPQYSYLRLREAFDKARNDYRKEVVDGQNFIENHLRNRLAEQFRVGWGNRLGRQVEQYVPVILAAGGTLSEAMDYLVAMKLVRKIRNRYENRREDIESFQDHLQTVWPQLDGSKLDGANSKLVQMLNEEKSRLGRNNNEG